MSSMFFLQKSKGSKDIPFNQFQDIRLWFLLRSASISDRILDWNAEKAEPSPHHHFHPPPHMVLQNQQIQYFRGRVSTGYWSYMSKGLQYSVWDLNIYDQYPLETSMSTLWTANNYMSFPINMGEKNIARITQTEDYSVTVYVNGWPTNIALFPHEKTAD